MADQNKTEKATPRRREKARKEGQVARSRELPAALVLLSAVLLVYWSMSSPGTPWRDAFQHFLDFALTRDFNNDPGAGTAILALAGKQVLQFTLPVLAGAWVISLAGTVAQSGFIFAPSALAPNWSRLSPVSNLGKLFSPAALSGMLKSLIPLGVLFYIFTAVLARDWNEMIQASRSAPRVLISWTLSRSYELLWKSGLVFLVWAGIDFMLQRFNFNRQLRMSHQEIREEHKEMEGSPLVRGRIRRLQRQMRRARMLHDVSRATVVVTNPDHYAIALEYHPETTAAPVVVAKGRNLFAQQLKEKARWLGVPMVENRLLAQALYRGVEVGQAIPEKLYAAVAEILAFIYRTQTRAHAAFRT